MAIRAMRVRNELAKHSLIERDPIQEVEIEQEQLELQKQRDEIHLTLKPAPQTPTPAPQKQKIEIREIDPQLGPCIRTIEVDKATLDKKEVAKDIKPTPADEIVTAMKDLLKSLANDPTFSTFSIQDKNQLDKMVIGSFDLKYINHAINQMKRAYNVWWRNSKEGTNSKPADEIRVGRAVSDVSRAFRLVSPIDCAERAKFEWDMMIVSKFAGLQDDERIEKLKGDYEFFLSYYITHG